MKFRKNSNNRDLDLNITPLIDIVFLLLIFFMVSTNFNKVTQINLNLPEVSKQYHTQDLASINLKVTANGNYLINDIPVNGNDKHILSAALSRYVKSNATMPFTIYGDAKAPHQAVVNALDAAGELGFKQIRIAAVSNN